MPANHRTWTPIFSALFLLVFSEPVATQPRPETILTDGPRLILRDSVVLREVEDFYAGKPSDLLLGSDGSFFVVDVYSARILRFDRSGRPVRAYGRRGQGPGEFVNIMGFASFVHDGVLAVADGQPPISMRLEFFGLDNGKHLGRAKLDGVVTALAIDGERLWAGGMDIDEWKSLGSTSLAELFKFNQRQGSAVALDRVSVPRPYVENHQIMIMGGLAAMDVGDNDVLITFRTSPYILRVNHDGNVVDTIPLHPRERRGVPDDEAFMALATLPASATPEQTQEFHRELDRSVSLLLHVSRDATGRIFTVHADVERRGQRDFSGILYVSSLSQDGTTQCSDTLVPASDVALPVVALRGSELFVLDQRIGSGRMGNVQTVVRSFTIDPDTCNGTIETGARVAPVN